VYRLEFLDCLYFQNQFRINDNIEFITAIKIHPFVSYWQWLLSNERQVAKGKLAAKALLVSAFKQAGTKGAMYFGSSSDAFFT